MVKIISDSTCDMPKELIEKYNITIIPLHIVLHDKEYRDGVDITPDKIYEWADANKTTPKTSAVSIEDAKEVFTAELAKYDSIIAFGISSAISATVNVMRIAAEELNASDRVTVIDSANLSTGISLLVVKAAEMAMNRIPHDEIVSTIHSLIPKVRTSFVVDTLTYLYRGGRCTAITALAGGVLKIHPEILVVDGVMDVGKKYRGPIDHVLQLYEKDLEEKLVNIDSSRVFITYSAIKEETVLMLKDLIEKTGKFDEIILASVGGVIASHCGPGTLGILYIDK